MSPKDIPSLGIKEIDRQHQQLLLRINDIYTVYQYHDKSIQRSNEVQLLLKDLLKEAKYHFEFEENVLKTHFHPHLEQHKTLHQTLLQQLTDIQPPIRVSLFSFLENWFMDHLIKEDQSCHIENLQSNLLAITAHELKTPLTSVLAHTKLLEAGQLGPLTDAQLKYFEVINRNLERISSMINDLLNKNTFQISNNQSNRERVAIGIILQNSVTALLPHMEMKKLQLQCSIPNESPHIKGNEQQLHQIFMNLLINAIKYTESGFIKVTLESQMQTIAIRIQDSGIGISREEQKKIFGYKFRSSNILLSDKPGMGFGLWLTKTLVQENNGTITLESEVGKGSTFFLTFPISHSG